MYRKRFAEALTFNFGDKGKEILPKTIGTSIAITIQNLLSPQFFPQLLFSKTKKGEIDFWVVVFTVVS
jgi:hypothetical protein